MSLIRCSVSYKLEVIFCSKELYVSSKVEVIKDDNVFLSLMAQYFPTYKAKEDNLINRKLTRREYKKIEQKKTDMSDFMNEKSDIKSKMNATLTMKDNSENRKVG